MFSEPQIWHRKKSRGGSHRAKCQLSALHYVRDVDHVDQCADKYMPVAGLIQNGASRPSQR